MRAAGGGCVFHDPGRFSFTARLEAVWRDVRREADALRPEDWFPWYEPGAYSGDWSVCGVHAGEHSEAGRLSPDVVRRCPLTTSLVRAVPGLRIAAFSRLGPGAMIHPHRDVGPRGLRCHLGLRVPAGCTFRVGDTTVTWQEGRCVVFETDALHAAWNTSSEARVLLLVEVDPPDAPA
jgi:aspartyl/asparaginyl beta-hydroxylase (cupin superfamily)